MPEGAARGAAFLARVASGLESDQRGEPVGHYTRAGPPDPAWAGPVRERYQRFLELASLR